MDIDWKDVAKKASLVGLVIAFIVWLLSPADPRFNRKKP